VSVTILLFASIAEAAGTRRLELPVQGGEQIRDLRDAVFARYPALARFAPNLLFALDEEYATLDTPVAAGATLAFIPPVSGG
jgi:molybdopterin synthase catalytic subunit